ncbi:MAG TPA: cupin domain-containing protein [Candidatus Thermoplasmatota archaeon]
MPDGTHLDMNAMEWTPGIGPGIVDRKLVTGPDTRASGEHFLMGVAKMGPGVKSPPHRHRNPQIFLILEGQGRAVIEGEEFKIAGGHVLRLLNYEEHTIINDGPGDLTLLEVRVFSTPRNKEEIDAEVARMAAVRRAREEVQRAGA